MNDLQKCQVDILDVTVETLEKEGYYYWLGYGTVIGAVRHKGFIPWDDDIDICMFIDEYDEFANKANEILPKGYFYQDKNTDKEYPYNFAKIRKDDTLFVQKPVQKFNMHHGVYIDIFPLVGTPNGKLARKIFIKKVKILGKIAIAPALVDSDTTQKGIKRILAKILLILNKIIGKDALNKKLYKMGHKYALSKSEYVADIYGGLNVPIKKDIYINQKGYKMETFEGKEYKCPECVDEYLTQIYGDYMVLPPEDKRVSHHQVVEIKL